MHATEYSTILVNINLSDVVQVFIDLKNKKN